MGARYQALHGRVVAERQRWPSESAGDSVVLDIQTVDTGDVVQVKGRENLAPIIYRRPYTFFGSWSNYTNKHNGRSSKQLQFFGYVEERLAQDAIEMLELLLGHGFPRWLACELVAEGITTDRVRQNPYRLLAYPGCGFKRTDELWLFLKKPKESLKRQAMCLWHGLDNPDSGSTWKSSLACQLALKAAIPQHHQFDRAVRLGVRSGLLARRRTDTEGRTCWDGDCVWYASRRMADMEKGLAEMYVRLQGEPRRWPEISQGNLSDHQFAAANAALRTNVGILTGGGGVGKTHTSAAIVQQLIASKGAETVRMVAPTGKAAVRLTEMLGLGIKATTIHSALGFTGSGWTPNKQLSEDGTIFVVADEQSMTDLELMWRLFQASRDCSILLVGDPYQLPPVGPGAPFRDMIANDRSVGKLTEVRRNSGSIVAAGDLIRQGKPFEEHLNVDNLWHDELTGSYRIQKSLWGELERLKGENFNPVWDCQVLAAVNQRSKLSTHELNLEMQRLFNSANIRQGNLLTLDDKVMNTRNTWLPHSKDCEPGEDASINRTGEVYVANGEIGRVVDVSARFIVVELSAPFRRVIAPTWDTDPDESEEGDTGSRFVLAYAITTHKSQGSQWPNVLIAIDDYAGARQLIDRSLIYTAISRASRRCFLAGPMSVMDGALRKNSIWDRRTFLQGEILEAFNHDY